MSITPINSEYALMLGLLLILLLTIPNVGNAQQIPDKSFHPAIHAPAFQPGAGPQVCLDEAHSNFHTLENRFWPFAELLRRDGYVMRANRTEFSSKGLAACRILVIANAQLALGENWDNYPYPTPSAFSDEEVAIVRHWVGDGGSLLLIADHMPFPGAAMKLAAAFGIEFNDGFAVESFTTEAEGRAAFAKPTLFSVQDGTIANHPITRGRNTDEAITSIRTFTGQAFRASASAMPLLVLPGNFISLMPEKAWKFTLDTKRIPVGGWLQGATIRVGAGRAAIFGEAGMFTAQIQTSGNDRQPMGMNATLAEQNPQFILNTMHWLSGMLGEGTGNR